MLTPEAQDVVTLNPLHRFRRHPCRQSIGMIAIHQPAQRPFAAIRRVVVGMAQAGQHLGFFPCQQGRWKRRLGQHIGQQGQRRVALGRVGQHAQADAGPLDIAAANSHKR